MSRTSSSRRRPSASRPKPVPKKPPRKKQPRKTSTHKRPIPKKSAQKKPIYKKRSSERTPHEPYSQSPRDRELTTKRRGELAELAFTLRAYQLGFGVSKPYGDSERYDTIVDPRDLCAPHLPTQHVPTKICHPERSNPIRKADRIAKSKDPAPAGATADLRKVNPQREVRSPRAAARPLPPAASPPLWRVQVKCTTHLLEGFYHLDAQRHTGGRAVPYLPGEIDFLAAYILPEDSWYIIPLSSFLGRTALLFRRRDDPRPGHYDAYREAWPLLRP